LSTKYTYVEIDKEFASAGRMFNKKWKFADFWPLSKSSTGILSATTMYMLFL